MNSHSEKIKTFQNAYSLAKSIDISLSIHPNKKIIAWNKVINLIQLDYKMTESDDDDYKKEASQRVSYWKTNMIGSYRKDTLIEMKGNFFIDISYGKGWREGGSNLLTFDEAKGYCSNLTFGEIEKWRLPTVKELRILKRNISIKKGKPKLSSKPSYHEGIHYWSSYHSGGGYGKVVELGVREKGGNSLPYEWAKFFLKVKPKFRVFCICD